MILFNQSGLMSAATHFRSSECQFAHSGFFGREQARGGALFLDGADSRPLLRNKKPRSRTSGVVNFF